ncbi:MAG TPA: hypothetical protein VGL59_15130 [Polyangia bacterium]
MRNQHPPCRYYLPVVVAVTIECSDQRSDLVDPPTEDTMEMKGRERGGAAEVAAARKSLDDARNDLDAAVAALPDIDGDEAMASPVLVALLVRAVKAKKHLKGLEVLALAPASACFPFVSFKDHEIDHG